MKDPQRVAAAAPSRRRGPPGTVVGRLFAVLVLVSIGVQPLSLGAQEPQQEAYGRTPTSMVPYREGVEPYRKLYLEPFAYRGPGRVTEAPHGLATVKIGLLAPLQGTSRDVEGRSLQRGVELALQGANRAGGYDGTPFELVSRNDQLLWGSSSNTLVDLAYAEQVWAVIGSLDSTSTHVALRAALKAELFIVNVGSTDPTVTETGIPWITRCTPDDRQTGYRIANLVFEELDLSRVAVLRSSDRYGRLGVAEFSDAAVRLRRPLPMEIQFEPGDDDFESELRRVEAAKVEAVVVWASARDAANLVRQMRQRGMSQTIVGTDRLASPEFLRAAGDAAEGVIATSWIDPTRDDDTWNDFRSRFTERYDAEPDAYAAYGYDAAVLTVEAIRRVGLNRALLRDALSEFGSYHGVAGTIELDTTANNVAPVFVTQVRGGELVVR
jgi:ABC-type branched-subunit amino acid transport system substrate-binding protein